MLFGLRLLQVPFILDQLEQIQLRGGAHPFANRPLVILADKDKEELDSLVSHTCGGCVLCAVHEGYSLDVLKTILKTSNQITDCSAVQCTSAAVYACKFK